VRANSSTTVQTGTGTLKLTILCVPCLFSEGKSDRSWSYTLIHSTTKVNERVELYLYSPSGPSWSFLRRPVPLVLTSFKSLSWAHNEVRRSHPRCHKMLHNSFLYSVHHMSSQIFSLESPIHAPDQTATISPLYNSATLSLLYLFLQHQSLLFAGGNLSAGVSPSVGGSLSAGGSPLLAEARWGAFSGFVPEISVVLADVVGCPRVVGGAAVAVSGLRAAVCL